MTMANRWLLAALLAAAAPRPAAAEPDLFETKIRPLFAEKCYSCHTASKLGGLRLDSRDALLAGGKSGPAVLPGKPGESLLLQAVSHADPKRRMPMAGERLTARELADLRQWILDGAPWPEAKAPAPSGAFRITPEQRKFWSFQPVRKPEPPAISNAAWPRGPVDRFVLAKLEANKISPSGPAEKRVLLRRVHYDLTGLPPTPEQVDAFLNDSSPDAFARVVDRLLASPQYAERWARHWLDVARYADGSGKDSRPVFLGYGMARDGYANTWRYRDWVVNAFASDMPYDRFVKAQIAADLMPGDKSDLLPGLGFFGIGPWFTGDDVVFVEARANERDDKIDALTKGFLGLTVTCARCHDHKYDPISQKDYYALAGVFHSSGYAEYDLAPPHAVETYKRHWKQIREQQSAIERYVTEATLTVAEKLAGQTATYMMAARRAAHGSQTIAQLAATEKLDEKTLNRWAKYLAAPAKRQHPYLKQWDPFMAPGTNDAEARRHAEAFQSLVLDVIAAKKAVRQSNEEITRDYRPDPNEATAALPGDLMQFEFFQYKQLLVQKVMETHKHYVWLDVVQGEASPDYPKRDAIFENPGKELVRFLTADQKSRLDQMQAELARLEKSSPPEYPYLMGLADAKPINTKLAIRGNVHAPGEEVPRGFPAILAGTDGPPKAFTQGSGRLELAEAIVSHPLAARVMVNRVWMHHFGRGLVASPSNFGVMGERPSHPELLDYLAARFKDSGWSVKALHREILLSATYQQSASRSAANEAIDPDNRLLWRANFRRLDAESLRDSLLFVSGALDERTGGPPQELNKAANKKRTVYARIRRSGPEGVLALFDFPDPAVSGEQRSVTNVPLQGLFFLNSDLMLREAERLAERLTREAPADAARIDRAYRLLYGRSATQGEVSRGLRFLSEATGAKASPWQQYAQALLSSGEFLYLN